MLRPEDPTRAFNSIQQQQLRFVVPRLFEKERRQVDRPGDRDGVVESPLLAEATERIPVQCL